ncbi:MAG TPA: Ig-like domain-containing protein, partial [Thermoplasmata archaeon]|nr:Ig-like domain-containing protein [Thermoplasmata archaeon]
MGPARTAIRGVPGSRISAALFLLFFLGMLPLLSTPAAAVTSVAIVSPVGGELWSGGSARTIVWDLATDSNNDIDVEYLVNGTPTLIERRLFVLPGQYTTSWATPGQDLANVTVRVCATDAVPVECASSPPFAIDSTVPLLVGPSPMGNNVGLEEPVDFHFSEEMNRTRVEAAITVSPNPGNFSFAKIAGNGTRVNHPPFLPGRVYDVTLSCAATDLSDPGNGVSGCPVSWSFRTATPPSISVTSPVAGDVWSGGASHVVRWTVADAEDPASLLNVSLERSSDGTTWSPVAALVPGDASYPWVTPLEDGTFRLRALVVDTRGLNATAVSSPFAIDSTPPSVGSTSPPAGTVGASWTDPIRVRFSEDVAGPLTAATFGLRDAADRWVAGALAWVSSTEFEFVPATHLRAFTMYTGRVNGTIRDASDPGNPIASPFEWTFATRANNAPTIAFDFSPGPVLTGGSVWSVAWSASDPDGDPATLSVYLEFSDGGAFVPVAGPLPAASAIAWTVPAVDTGTAALLVRVVDLQGSESTDAVTFAIDATPPRIVTASPPSGVSDAPPDTIVHLTFSEPVTDVANFVGIRDVASQAWMDVFLSWEDEVILHVQPAALLREMETYEVVVNGTARDRSLPGNFVEPASWTFRIASFPPTLAVISPSPNARWTAGSAQLIRILAVDARDPSVAVSADLALDGFLFEPLVPAASVPGGTAVLPVTAPPIDAPNAVLRVCAADAAGATTCAHVRIGIDAIRPRVAQSVPPAGTKQVHPDAPLVITFTESMNPAAVESAFSLNPATPLAFRWARTAADNDTVFVDHPRFLGLRTYIAAIDCPAKDASVPGLPMAGACPLSWTFTTAAAPEILLLSPGPGERLTGGVLQTVRWVAAEEEGSVRITAELSVDGGVTFPFPLVPEEPFVPGDARTERAFPAVSTANAFLRIRAEDSLGLAAVTMSGPFAIDAVAPSLASVSPPDASVDVSPLEDLVFVFSESMDPSSAYALAVAPSFRDAVLSWSATNVPFDTLTITHS